MNKHYRLLWLLMSLTFFVAATTQAQVFSVTTTADAGEGSLRQAMLDVAASTSPGPFTITATTSGTIDLTTALPDIVDDVTFLGPGASSLTVRRSTGTFRIFHIPGDNIVSFEGFTIADGSSDFGGGIRNAGRLTVTNCVLRNNQASSQGGGIYSSGGSSTLTSSTLTTNGAGRGGAIANVNHMATLSSCVIQSNTATGSGSSGGGGGIHSSGGSSTLTSSTLTSNRAIRGGAIANLSHTATLSSCVIQSNTATGSSVGLSGGGIYNSGGSSTLTSSTLTSNRANFGGAIYNESNHTATLSSCVIQSNAVTSTGGGIYNDGGSSTLTSSTLTSNEAFSGGAIYNESNHTATLSNCVIQSNTATGPGNAGGGGIYSSGGSSTLTSSTLTSNRANLGGGIYNVNHTATVSSCMIQSNTATGSGGGISSSGGSSTVVNSAFLNNQADRGGAISNVGSLTALLTNISFQGNNATTGTVFNIQNGTIQLTNGVMFGNGVTSDAIAGGTIQATYSLFETDVASYTGTNNLTTSTSPFASTTGVALNACSPAINAGNNAAPGLAGISVDLVGNTRVFSTTVDMGAVELQSAPASLPSLTVTASPSFTITNGNAITLTASGATSYTWTEGGGLPGLVSSTFTASPTATTVYSVTGTTAGCTNVSSVSSVTVTVNAHVCYSVVYVTQNGAGLQNGSSWTNAYPGTMLQAAINSATSCSGQVWVAAGLYKPTTGTDRSSSFALRNGVAIYGGFAGTETALTDRNPSTNPTILSGEIGSAGLSDNCYHVIYNAGLNNTAILDGFVITAGNANGTGSDEDAGGGIRSNNGRPIVRNCLFRGNSATFGGAFYSQNNGNPTLTNCGFLNNTATNSGGAIYVYNDSPALTNSSFQGNMAPANSGGAIGSDGGNAPTLTNCVLFDNDGANTIFNGGNQVSATYTLFNADATGYSGTTGNLTTSNNPFVSATSLELTNNAPAINAGDPATTTVTLGTTIDLAGNPRVFGGQVDMGAYELQTAPAPSIAGFVASPNPVCTGNAATFTATIGNVTGTYDFTLSNGTGPLSGTATGATFSQTLTVAGAGVQTYTLTIGANATTAASTTLNVGNHPDYPALLDLYTSTNGVGWLSGTNWLSGCDPCSVVNPWFGVTCTGGRVISLDLSRNRLIGSIPNSLSALTNLEYLYLFDNQLSGNIPASLSALTNLQYLFLNVNQLSGTIPDGLSALTNLNELWLNNNQLSGSIPSSLSTLTNLGNLRLQNNRLSGSIPDGLSALTNLGILMLHNNQLSGGIPSSLASLTRLIYLGLNNNQLSGNIPVSLSAVTNLQYLYLNVNQLSGTIPDGLSALTNLRELHLNDNQLSGCFPASLSFMCGQTTNFSNNTALPGGGSPDSFSAFCASGAGSDGFVTVASASQTALCVGNTLSLSVNGGSTATFNWLAPAGVTLGNPATNSVVSATANTSGVKTFTVTVSFGSSCSSTAMVSVTVDALPTPILTASPSSTLTCAQTSLTLTVTSGAIGAPTGYTFSGPGLSQSGSLSTAVVNQAGVYSVTAQNASGCTSTTSTTISSGTATVSVTNPTILTAVQTIAFSQTFTASGGVAPRIFTLASGTLPTGLTLGTDGVLSGTPTQTGTFTFTVRATDANSCSGLSSTYSLTVAGSAPLVITALSPARNALTAPAPANVAITFSEPLSTGTASLTTLRMFSAQRGGLLRDEQGGTTTINNNTLTFAPTTNFRPGETLMTTVLSSLQSTTGTTLTRGQVQGFTVETGGTGRGNFMTHPVNATLAAGDNPSGLALGDVNGDGHLDLVTANLNSNNLSVLLNNGTGSFPISSTVAAGNGPQRLALGDVDGDGDLDLVTANSLSSNLSVLLNNGTGSFPTHTTFAVGNTPRGVALSDLDGDGDLDLATANNSNVSVLLNNGAGSFSPTTNIAVGGTPQNLAPGDLDSDGDIDLITANINGDNVSVLLNSGMGSFSTPTNFTVDDGPQSVALGDIDGDGDLDFVAGNASTNNVSVRLNNGAGSFTNHPVNPAARVSATPRSVALSDVDSDGDLDLITVSSQDRVATVLLNDGTGNFLLRPFNSSISLGNGPRGGMLGDIDSDGDLDLVVANGDSDNVSVFLNQSLPAIDNLSVSPATACAGQSTTITATIANLTGVYNFTLSNGINTSFMGNRTGPLSLTHIAIGAGVQTFTLTISQGTFSTTATIDQTVSARPAPLLTPSPSATLSCANPSLALTATGGTSYTFARAGGGGIVSQDQNAGTAVVNQSGTYSVTVANASGCTSSTTATVLSNTTVPTVSISATSGTLTCATPTLTLTATSSGTGVRWSTTESTTSIVVSTSGTYSVTATASNGCTNTTRVSINTDLAGASPASTLSASSSVVCAGANVQVVATGGSSPMQWYHNGSVVAGQTSATLSLGGVQQALAGQYVLVVTGACSVTSAPFSLTVNPLPTVTLIVPGNASVSGATITLPAPFTGNNFQVLGGVSFERLIVLDRINGFEIRQVDSNGSGVFPINRTGPFRLTVTGGNGCKRTVEGVVQIQ